MKNIPINDAETILEPFWDGGSSEHPKDKMNRLDDYTVTVPNGVIASVEQIWCALQVKFSHGVPGSVITMSRNCDVNLVGYDTFRIFASIPSHVRLTVTGTVDGRHVSIIDGAYGKDTNDEFDGPLDGSRLSSLTVAYCFTDPRPVSMQVLWFGLANKKRQAELEQRKSPYSADWTGYILPRSTIGKESLTFSPSLGLLLNDDEMVELRDTLHSGPLSKAYHRLLEHARSHLEWKPEEDIGKYVPKPDRRWVRNRDMDRRCTAGIMEILAFTGMIEQDYELTGMACRMALAACHCETWSESVVGALPGTTWHHRSFTEEIYCRACGLVLDWAGFALSPHAHQLIRDSIIMKGLPRIESDFKRMEYIRHMNQGIVFSSGRIFGTLALLNTHPRYESVIAEAERDLHEMIDSYVHNDGGTLEGMAYWAYTFSSAMPVIYALARYHKITLADYASETLRKTGDYGLGMLSSAGDGSTYLPVNDAHADTSYPAGLLAGYAEISGNPEWRRLYNQAILADEGIPDLYHLILAPRGDSPTESDRQETEGFWSFPDVGQVSSVRRLADGAGCLLHLCSGPTHTGHFHEDKGAIIIEAGGETLAYDRGVTDYHHPETGLMKMASRHNLVYPVPQDGGIEEQPGDCFGGVLSSSAWKDDIVLACSENTTAWGKGLFTRNYRRICSPSPDIILVDDELILPQPTSLRFLINTPFAAEHSDTDALIRGAKYMLNIVPLNWKPADIDIGMDGVDSHLRETNVVRMEAKMAAKHRLITLLEIVPVDQHSRWTVLAGSNPLIQRDSEAFAIAKVDDDYLRVTVERNSGPAIIAECAGGEWRVSR